MVTGPPRFDASLRRLARFAAGGAVDGSRDEIVRRIDEGRREVVAQVAAVGAKVDKIRRRKNRKSKYGEAARAACLAFWNMAHENEGIRNSINTRLTHESVFKYFRRRLAAHGIDTVKKFKTVLHSAQSLECNRRKRALEAKADAQTSKR